MAPQQSDPLPNFLKSPEPTGKRRKEEDMDSSLNAWLEDLEKQDTSQQHPNKLADRSRIGGAIFGTIVIGVFGLKAPFVFTKSRLPYMATPATKIRKALQHLGKEKKPGLFVDLGSGDGEGVYQAAKFGYNAVGIELNFTMWALSSIRRRLFWTAAERSRSKLLWSDLFEYDLRDANAVMIFGVTPLMKPLSQKISSQCKSGTDILSYRFSLPLAHDKKTQNLMKGAMIYDHEEMRIYRCK